MWLAKARDLAINTPQPLRFFVDEVEPVVDQDAIGIELNLERQPFIEINLPSPLISWFEIKATLKLIAIVMKREQISNHFFARIRGSNDDDEIFHWLPNA